MGKEMKRAIYKPNSKRKTLQNAFSHMQKILDLKCVCVCMHVT